MAEYTREQLMSMSVEQLKALRDQKIAAGKAPAPSKKYTREQLEAMPVEQLQQLKAEKLAQQDQAGKVIDNEQHPDIGFLDRFVAKNLTTDTAAAVKYLQKKHPQLSVSTDDTGNIIAKRADEKDWRVLDPDTGVFSGSTEMVNDIADGLWDIGSGIGMTAASAAGGIGGALAGGALGGGVGAIPGAAVGASTAGAAAGGGLEYLRQGIGKMIGVDQDIDHSQAAMMAGAGAVSPIIFGSGAAAGTAAKASGVLPALAGRAAANGVDDAAIQAAQSGLLGRAWDATKQKFLPWLGSKASGVSADAIRTYGNKLGRMTELEADPMAVTNVIEKVRGETGNTLTGLKNQKMGEYFAKLGEVEGTIDVSSVVAKIDDQIARAKDMVEKSGGSPKSKEYLQKLLEVKEEYFTGETKQLVLDPQTLNLDEKIVKQVTTELPAVAAARLEQDLGDLAEVGLMGKNQSGIGNRFTGKGFTRDEREIARLGDSMRREMKTKIESKLGREAMAAREETGKIIDAEKKLSKLFHNEDTGWNILRNGSRHAKRATFERFADIDKKYKTNLLDNIQEMHAYSVLGKPASLPISSDGVTSTARTIGAGTIGASLGYWAAGQSGGDRYAGAAMGGLAGGVLGGPAAIRQYIRRGSNVQNMTRAVNNNTVRGQSVMNSFWGNMVGEDVDK